MVDVLVALSVNVVGSAIGGLILDYIINKRR